VIAFGNEPTGVLLIFIPVYAVGLFLAYTLLGGWAWYRWLLAVAAPICLVLVLMVVMGWQDERAQRRGAAFL